jgi:hypothetical protein
MAASDKISGYNPSTRTILKDTDRLDISEDDGVGGFDTVYKVASDLKPIVAQKLSFDCGGGSEGTVSMDWRCSGKFTAAYMVMVIMKVSAKSNSAIQLQIGSTSGGSDIMPIMNLSGGAVDMVFPVHLEGATTGISSDTGTYFLTLVSGYSSAECDVLVYAHHEDL